MNKHRIISIVFVIVIFLSLTSCYTQLIVKDSAHYEDNSTIIIVNPAPPPYPCPVPTPPVPPIYHPHPIRPIIKDREPDPPPPPSNTEIRDRLRNTGGRSDENKGSRR